MTVNKYSDYKIAWFPDKLNSLKDDIITPPLFIRFKPTNRCNHKCSWCVYSDASDMHNNMNAQDEIPVDKCVEILKDIKDIGVEGVCYSGGGEPLIHNNIQEILQETIKQDLSFALYTNGQNLTKDIGKLLLKSQWIRISMDYYDEKSFIKSGRGNATMFNKLIENVYAFSDENYLGDLGVNYIITEDNYMYLEESINLMLKMNINNIRFSPVWTNDFVKYHLRFFGEVTSKLKYLKNKYNKYITIYDSYSIKDKSVDRSYTKCYAQQMIPVIGADQNVYNCHNKAYDNSGLIGSIKDQKFSELWFSDETKHHFNNFNPQDNCIHECANDKKNLFIHELMNCHGDIYV